MPDDGTIKLGYDGKKVEAGFASLESRSKKTSTTVEGHFRSLSSRIGGHFKNVGTGIAQGIGQGLWATIGAAANKAGQQIAGVNLTDLADSAINANQILDALLDRATKLGTSAESLQRLELFGAVNGKSADEMVDSLARLNRSLADVGENKKAREAFRDIGIDAEAFARLEPDRQFITLARAFQTAEKNGTGLSEIYDLLSKSGGGLLQVLRQPVDDLDALAGAKVIPEAVVLRASEIADELTRAADAKNKLVLESRTGLQLSDQEKKRLEEQAALRAKAQQAVRDAAATQIAADIEAAPDDGEALREKEKQESRARALADLQAELAIMDQRARGHEKEAVALERKQRIIEATRAIQSATGLDAAAARNAATARVDLEDRVNASASTGDDGGRKKIRGYSRAQRESNPFLKTRANLSFNEFFHAEDTANGRRARGPLSETPFNQFFPDPKTGRRRPSVAAAAVNGPRDDVGKAGGEGKNLVEVNNQILAELRKLTSLQ